MKKFDRIILWTLLLYCVFGFLIWGVEHNTKMKENLQYKVEINEILRKYEEKGGFFAPDLQEKLYIKEVSYLPAQETDETVLAEFYENHNNVNSSFRTLQGDGNLLGYVRFDYITVKDKQQGWWLPGVIVAVSGLFLVSVLLYIRNKMVKPFHVLSDMPYELSKGHLKGELQESKSRFFGKFVWGISMLRDTLQDSKIKELRLEKDKKMLLLSLSHDIKIPLSTIKLYAKALKEKMYTTEQEKEHAAAQIERHALEIENFVKEIITTSSEDILSLEVQNSEFYLKDLLEKVRTYYESKCNLMQINFVIDSYENKLLKGDMERAFEVMENLMENAFKYGDGNRITISCYEEEYCQIVSVSNTGTVVPAEEMPHLFDSFYRGSNVGGKDGNGLGLYIGRQIMRKMEGDIFAEKAENGMRFHMVFRM